jgi:hypothetical protein
MGSGFDDWVYWHFFTLTINYYSSQSILTPEASLHSASRSTTDCKRSSLSPINLRHGPRTENTLRTPHPSNSSIFVLSQECLCQHSLPINGYPRYNIYSSVGIATRLLLDDRGFRVRFPAVARDSSLFHRVQTECGSYVMVKGGSFPRDNPGRV